MRFFNLIIIISCLLHFVCKGQLYYNNYYTNAYINLGSTNIYAEPDSSFVFFSFTKNMAGGRQDFTASKLDKYGNLQINNNNNINNLDYSAYLNGLKQFIAASPSSYFATTCVFNYTTNICTLVLNKINRVTLDTLFTKYYSDSFYYFLPAFIKVRANKFYLIGGKSTNTSRWPCIFELDSNLTIQNSITLNNPNNIITADALYDTVNKKILINGRVSASLFERNFSAMLCDTLGNIITTTTYSTTFTNGNNQLFYSASDNSYVGVGGIKTSVYGNNALYRLQISKYDANLNPLWHKTYGQAALINGCYDAVLNADGSVVVAGKYSDSTSLPLMNLDANGFILKINSNGDSLWMHQYNNYVTGNAPGSYWEGFYGIEKTLDGGYILCGGVSGQPQAKAWIVKTDSLGCVNSGCAAVIMGTLTTNSVEETMPMNAWKIYPNPANQELYVEFGATLSADNETQNFEIINSMGVIVYEFYTLYGTKIHAVNCRQLPEGIYFIRSKNNIHISKRFVVSHQ